MNIAVPSRLAVTGASRKDVEAVSRGLALASGCERLSIGDIDEPPTAGKLADTVGFAVQAFERRVDLEARASGSFIAEGAVISEWAEAEARRSLRRRSLNPAMIPFQVLARKTLAAHAGVVSRRCGVAYDAIIHLQSDLPSNSHEALFRETVNDLLLTILEQGDVPYLVVSGSVEKMVNATCEILRLPLPIS